MFHVFSFALFGVLNLHYSHGLKISNLSTFFGSISIH